MRKLSRLFLGMALAGTMAITLTGCGNNDDKPVVKVFNWGDYIDPEVNKIFEEETGIRVIYSELK